MANVATTSQGLIFESGAVASRERFFNSGPAIVAYIAALECVLHLPGIKPQQPASRDSSDKSP